MQKKNLTRNYLVGKTQEPDEPFEQYNYGYRYEDIPVEGSSVLAAAHYDNEDGSLHVEFRNGGAGTYIGVPRDVVFAVEAKADNRLKDGKPSHGATWFRRIREGNFTYIRD